jgi:hypothetical protein
MTTANNHATDVAWAPATTWACARGAADINDHDLDSGYGQAFRRLIEARGTPSREDAPWGARKEPLHRNGHEVPAHREADGFAEGAGRRSTRQHGITARGRIQARA